MNKIKTVTWTAIRCYVRKRTVGASSKLVLLDDNESNKNIEDVDIEDHNFDDLGEYEPDITQAHEYYQMHEREKYKTKEILKNKITAKKYFKTPRPNFLTFIEKEKIRSLHENDPRQWTVEKLSESFPALPATIAKILKAKWQPKSVDRVVKQDNVVAENWKLFRAGKLPVDMELRLHLMKFKDRKIILTDREILAEKLIPPKIEFPKPKSTLFSKIVEDYAKEKEDKRIAGGESFSDSQHNVPVNMNMKNKDVEESDLIETLKFEGHSVGKPRKNLLTFSQFGMTELKKSAGKAPERVTMLLDAYKNQVVNEAEKGEESIDELSSEKGQSKVPESTIMEEMKNTDVKSFDKSNNNKVTFTQTSTTIDDDRNISICKNDREMLKNSTESSVSTKLHEDDNRIYTASEKGNDELSTYVAAWHKKTEDNVDYTLPIKISKSLYKPGKLYRVKDCYYDDDGQFLYRVPGLKG